MNSKIQSVFFILSLFSLLHGQIPSGEAIIDSMTAVMSPESNMSMVKQMNHYANGGKRTFELILYSTNKGEKMIMQYIKPKSVKGQTFLLKNDGNDIWTYFPRTRRVRKMASHAKKMDMQGSDFSFGDFSSEDTWKNDYTTINTGEESHKNTSCWVLKAAAREGADVDYPAVIIYVRKDSCYPVKIDYMDEKGNPEKTLTLSEIVNIDGYPTAKLIEMKNHLTGTRTVMKTIETSNKWKAPKDFFTERNMKKDLRIK